MTKTEGLYEKTVNELRNAMRNSKNQMQYDGLQKQLRDIVSIRGEGVDEGREIGRKEVQLEIIKNLIKAGAEIELIVRATGISKAEIEQISMEFID